MMTGAGPVATDISGAAEEVKPHRSMMRSETVRMAGLTGFDLRVA
jgi:hypothetical protein